MILRRLEDRGAEWRGDGSDRLEADFLAYKAIKNKTNNLMNEARKSFFKEFVEENSTDQRELFSATKRLLGRENVVEYPQFDDKIALDNKFLATYLFKRLTTYRPNSTTWFRPLLSALPTSAFVMYRPLSS